MGLEFFNSLLKGEKNGKTRRASCKFVFAKIKRRDVGPLIFFLFHKFPGLITENIKIKVVSWYQISEFSSGFENN